MSLPLAGAPPQPTPGQNAITPEQKAEWDRLVADNDIVLFMKGDPEAPQCGFSARAAMVLQELGHPFTHVNVFAQDDPFTTIRAVAEWAEFPTLPQVWVKGELIGGSDIALDMFQSGELQKMLE